MKKITREITIAGIFVLISGLLYLLHYVIFHDKYHLFIMGMGELAFLPLEVLIVTAVLNRLLEWRDKNAVLSKKNMLIGSFFSEVGISMLRAIVIMDTNSTALKNNLDITNNFNKKNIKQLLRYLENYKPELKGGNKEISILKDLILSKRSFLSNLIQHPILLEHKAFTDLLLATYHLAEELSYRINIDELPEKDMNHLLLDISRVYINLLPEWIVYIHNLKDYYPYLFSLYIRLNPFKKDIDVIVT
jgi:hypothetical protein